MTPQRPTAARLRIGLAAAVLPLIFVTGCSDSGGAEPEGGTDAGSETTEEPAGGEAEAEAWEPTENITVVEPYDAGGGGDAYSRAIAGCFADQVPDGVEVIVENRTPAIDGIGSVWEAEPDGYTIGSTPLPTITGMKLAQPDSVPWTAAEFEPIGIAESNGYVLYVRGDSEYETIEDLQAATGLKTLLTNPGSGSSLASGLAIVSLDLDATQIFGAESSTEAALAMLRGEVDFTTHGASDYPDLVDSGEIRPLLFLGTEEQRSSQYEWLQEVPGMDSIDAPEMAGVVSEYRMFSAPPGTPENVLTYLRGMFQESFENGCMDEFSETTGRPLLPQTAEEAEEIAEKQAETIGELYPKLAEIQTM